MKKFFSLLLFLIAFVTVNAGSNGGIVKDSISGFGIPGTFIQYLDLDITTVSDEHGHFELQNNTPLPVRIKVSALGYESAILSIEESQLSDKMEILLIPAHNELDEISISVSSGVYQNFHMSNVENKTVEELQVIPSVNLSEAITNIASVYNNSTGNGIGKPVIRGLSGNRVVTSLNGLRIENQQFGGDHGLGVSSLGIEEVEIVKGPSSLIYGVDALGGVVRLKDEKYTAPGSVEASLQTQFESNSMSSRNLAGVKIGKEKLRFNLYGSYTSAADYTLANGQYAGNSRWQEGAFKTAVGYNTKKWLINVRYNYNRSFIGIPGHTHDSIIDYADFKTTTQGRSWILPVQQINSHFALVENVFFLKKGDLRLFTGLTSNHLVELEDRITIPGINNILDTYSYHLRYRYESEKKHQFVTGTQGAHQQNLNLPGADSQLIPNAKQLDQGAYGLWNWSKRNFESQLGARYDHRSILTDDKTYAFNAFNASASAVQKLGDFLFRLNLSTGYRPPNLSELTSDGVHHGTFRYELGDRNLVGEFAVQTDLSIEYKGEHLSFLANAFYNQIDNFIYIQPSDSVIENYSVFEYTQSGTANLMGGDAGFHYHPHALHQLHIESTLSYLYTEDNSGKPLPLIPQTRINNQLRWQFQGKGNIQLENIALQYLYFFAQNKIGLNETTSPSYQLLHLGAKVKFDFKNPLFLKFGVRNLLNENYTDHISRLKNIQLENPGRNIYVGLQWRFQKSKDLHKKNQ